MIYFVVFILLLIPVVKYDWMAKTGGERGWYYFNLVVLILLAGLRYRVGGDTLMYMSLYHEWPAIDELKYFDFESAEYNPLWYIYASVAKSISDEFWVLQLIQSVIVNAIFFYFFRKYCPCYYFTVILLYFVGYFCYFNAEVMREALCICILMLMTSWLLERKWLWFYLGSIVAVFIHYSAVVLFVFPILVLFFRKASWKMQIMLLVVVVLLMNVVNIPSVILSLFSVNEGISLLAEKYLDEQRSLMGMLFQLIKYLPLLAMIYLRGHFNKNVFSTIVMDFTCIVSGAVVVYAFSMSLEGFSRLINYFVPYILVYIVNTLYSIVSNVRFLTHQVSYIIMLAAFVLQIFDYSYYYAKDTSDVYPNTRFGIRYSPYHSILNPKIDETRERYIENDRSVVIDF